MLGSQEVDRVMLGTAEVWSNNPWKETLFATYSRNATVKKIYKVSADTFLIISSGGTKPEGFGSLAGTTKKLILYFNAADNPIQEVNPDTFSITAKSVGKILFGYDDYPGGTIDRFYGCGPNRTLKIFDTDTYVGLVESDVRFTEQGDGCGYYAYGIQDLVDYHRISRYDTSTALELNKIDIPNESWVNASLDGTTFGTNTKLWFGIAQNYRQIDPNTLTAVSGDGTFPNPGTGMLAIGYNGAWCGMK